VRLFRDRLVGWILDELLHIVVPTQLFKPRQLGFVRATKRVIGSVIDTIFLARLLYYHWCNMVQMTALESMVEQAIGG
jgi:hypothetical protein